MSILNILLIINYIIAVITMIYINKPSIWEEIKTKQSKEHQEFLKKSINEKAIKHIVNILLLIPGYALLSLIKQFFKLIF